MKVVRNHLRVLIAHKAQREQRRINLRTVAAETGISYYTITAIANDTIQEYPKEVLAKLCEYLPCDLSDLLYLTEIPAHSS